MKQKIIHILLNAYWRIFRPKTYGVKVLIVHPQDPHKILLVLHSYGDTTLWNIPGGGYNPRKETPATAAAREVREELGVELSAVQSIGQYYTEAQGKRDTVELFVGVMTDSDAITANEELHQWEWATGQQALSRDNLARIAGTAIRRHFALT